MPFVTESLAASPAPSASLSSIFLYIPASCDPGGLGSIGQNDAT